MSWTRSVDNYRWTAWCHGEWREASTPDRFAFAWRRRKCRRTRWIYWRSTTSILLPSVQTLTQFTMLSNSQFRIKSQQTHSQGYGAVGEVNGLASEAVVCQPTRHAGLIAQPGAEDDLDEVVDDQNVSQLERFSVFHQFGSNYLEELSNVNWTFAASQASSKTDLYDTSIRYTNGGCWKWWWHQEPFWRSRIGFVVHQISPVVIETVYVVHLRIAKQTKLVITQLGNISLQICSIVHQNG